MAGKNTAVFGIYQDRPTVESAVDMLQQGGFRNTDISVLFPYNEGTKDFAAEKNTKAPEGTAAGAGTGAVVGGTLGWLAGIGALAIPGLGPFIAAGPIMAALAGVGVGGAIGGLTGPSSEWVFRNMRRNASKAESKKAASSCPYTATVPTGPKRLRRFWNAAEPRIFHPRAKQAQIFPRATNLCRARANVVAIHRRTRPLIFEGFVFALSRSVAVRKKKTAG